MTEARRAPEEKHVKERLPVAVMTHHLAVEGDGMLQFGSEGLRESAEGLELVSIPRDELASAVLDLGQGTKTVILDFE